jgi:competence protein ComEC
VVAAAVVAGCWLAVPVAWPGGALVGGVAVAVGLARRRPLWLVAGGFGLATALAAQAWAAAAPLAPAEFAGTVTLRTDPAPLGPGVVAEVVRGGRHLEVLAFGSPARRLRPRLAGERVVLEGRLSRPPAREAAWLRSRHVIGVIIAARVSAVEDGTGEGGALARSANRVRRALAHGARTMNPVDRGLYLGFVIGDDREQPPELVDAFRAAGLSHLTAVSGQNVALLLAVAAPGLRRLPGTARWAATLALIGWFAAVTRFEPSVLRASVMAALAATSVVTGHPARPARVLGLTVTIVLLADPLLVHAVGWWLSLAATAGIAVLSRPLAARLPGPESVRAAAGVALAAQLGVAPVSLLAFGPVPSASLPANLLAAPAAGPVMLYGLPAGLVAAVLPAGLAWLVQLPTVVLVRYLAVVASTAARWPLPRLGAVALVVAGGGVALVLRRPPRPRR